MKKQAPPQTIDEYIASQPAEISTLLSSVREIITKAAPAAEECISYQMPAYKFHGMLVYFAAFKAHWSLFPTGSAVAHFADRLKEYKTTKGTIQVPYEKKIPVGLIRDIVKFRVQENLAKADAKARTKKKSSAKPSVAKKKGRAK